jgi:hypothetical protein
MPLASSKARVPCKGSMRSLSLARINQTKENRKILYLQSWEIKKGLWKNIECLPPTFLSPGGDLILTPKFDQTPQDFIFRTSSPIFRNLGYFCTRSKSTSWCWKGNPSTSQCKQIDGPEEGKVEVEVGAALHFRSTRSKRTNRPPPLIHANLGYVR